MGRCQHNILHNVDREQYNSRKNSTAIFVVQYSSNMMSEVIDLNKLVLSKMIDSILPCMQDPYKVCLYEWIPVVLPVKHMFLHGRKWFDECFIIVFSLKENSVSTPLLFFHYRTTRII